MSKDISTTRHWAVLVGINFYVKDKCLQGCVRDVQSVKGYLETAGSSPVTISLLTASNPKDPRHIRPPEHEDAWPNLKNLTGSLFRILREGKQGDHVYIHYSGHGTRLKNDQGRLDLAFVLYENNEHRRSYFRGQHLASALRRMVENGMLVTLVLDCCFSGSVRRDRFGYAENPLSRTTEYDPADDLEYHTMFHTMQGIFAGDFRDSRISGDWLLDPQGYTVLCACGPHEIAKELLFKNGSRSGALTFFLLEALTALRETAAAITHQSLYQSIRIRFHAEWPEQVPMRYGNLEFTFFGGISFKPGDGYVSIFKQGDQLRLDAGQAHGVHEGDEYAIFPINAQGENGLQAAAYLEKVRVNKVWPLVADVTMIDSNAQMMGVTTKCKAKALTAFSSWVMLVGAEPSIEIEEEWVKTMEKHAYFRLSTAKIESEANIFHIDLNDQNEYQILNQLRKVVYGLPTIPAKDSDSLQRVANILQHLSRFKYLERILNRNPSRDFEASFSVHSNLVIGEDGFSDISHGRDWEVTFTNLSNKALYLAVFNFTPSWSVVNLVSECGGGDFLVVPPKSEENSGEECIEITMEVPDFLHNHGQRQCEDLFKVFATSKATHFPTMILPSIVPPIGGSKASTSVHRGRDELSHFLFNLETSFRSPRTSTDDFWTTRSFLIRTTESQTGGKVGP